MKTKKGASIRATVASVLILVLTLALAGIVYAAAVTIDTFDNGSEDLLVYPTSTSTPTPVLTATAVYDGNGILGSERDSELYYKSGSGSVALKVGSDTYGTTFLRFDQQSGTSGTSRITWDGDDNSITLNPTGLGGIDLTGGGTNDGILLSIYFNDLKLGVTFKIYTNGSNWSQYQLTLAGGLSSTPGRMDIFLPFNSFTTGGGSGATFSNVGAVVMELNGQVQAGADTLIDFIEASNVREYGDLPSSYSVISAYHIPQGLRLGKNVDAETTYQASTGANGDDTNPSGVDDEDGVELRNLPWTTTGYIRVYRYGCPDSGCYINGWIDWNNDGDFADTVGGASEHVVNNQYAEGDGYQTYTFSTPSGYSNGYYYARFRICPTSTGCDDPGESPVTNGEVEDYRWPLGPTAVIINSFTARPASGGIRLTWQTADETDLVGFDLLRSLAEGGPYLPLNGEAIQAQHPGQPEGATYSWLDGEVWGGLTYYYRLDIHDKDGQTTPFGPVSATAWYRLYLPLVLR